MYGGLENEEENATTVFVAVSQFLRIHENL